MTEIMLRDVAMAHDLNYVVLRYFNVAGADPRLRCGIAVPGATHLLKVAVEAATGQLPKHHADRDPCIAYRRQPTHPGWVDRDSLEGHSRTVQRKPEL